MSDAWDAIRLCEFGDPTCACPLEEDGGFVAVCDEFVGGGEAVEDAAKRLFGISPRDRRG